MVSFGQHGLLLFWPVLVVDSLLLQVSGITVQPLVRCYNESMCWFVIVPKYDIISQVFIHSFIHLFLACTAMSA